MTFSTNQETPSQPIRAHQNMGLAVAPVPQWLEGRLTTHSLLLCELVSQIENINMKHVMNVGFFGHTIRKKNDRG
jgi:hypothetical protein